LISLAEAIRITTEE